MLRSNAAAGIKLPENQSNWTTEMVLKQWKIVKSVKTNGQKVKVIKSLETR